MPNILYLMFSANIFGGTPKKTLDLIKHSNNNCSIYFWSDSYNEHQYLFKEAGGNVYVGDYGRNIYKYIKQLLKIIDNENIEIIQTQFSIGEVLGGILKVFRPKVKLIVTYEGPFSPTGIKKVIANYFLKKVDAIVFISEYVKREKEKVFSFLKDKKTALIYNGTSKRLNKRKESIEFNNFSLFDIAGLVDWKNAEVLIKAVAIIKYKRNHKNIFLYIAGDGPLRTYLGKMIIDNRLEENVFLLGYQSNIGGLLEQCDIFVHPAYAEGFGIIIPEAMMAEKPIIVANAGALPELIENHKTGLVVDPYDAEEWADAIIKLMEDENLRCTLAKNAKVKAEADFSVEKYVSNYEKLYKSLLEKK